MRSIVTLLSFAFILACSSSQQLPKNTEEKDSVRMIEKSYSAFRSGRNIQAADAANTALNLARRVNNPDMIVRSLMQIARVQVADGHPEQALSTLKEAEETASRLANKDLPFVLVSQATIQWEKGDMTGFDKSITAIRALKDVSDELLATTNNLEALKHFSEARFSAAQTTAEIAYGKARASGNFGEMALSLSIISKVERREGKGLEAIKNMKAALDIYRSLGNPAEIMTALTDLAELSLAEGKKQDAFYYFYQAYETAIANDDEQSRQFFMNRATEILQ